MGQSSVDKLNRDLAADFTIIVTDTPIDAIDGQHSFRVIYPTIIFSNDALRPGRALQNYLKRYSISTQAWANIISLSSVDPVTYEYFISTR